MHTPSWIAVVVIVGLAGSPAWATHSLKPFHSKLTCESCHLEKAPTAPTVTQCQTCHGSAQDVAQLTQDRYKRFYNPHDSLHYATYADCLACHREHSESRLDCTNSNCHREFNYKVP